MNEVTSFSTQSSFLMTKEYLLLLGTETGLNQLFRMLQPACKTHCCNKSGQSVTTQTIACVSGDFKNVVKPASSRKELLYTEHIALRRDRTQAELYHDLGEY